MQRVQNNMRVDHSPSVRHTNWAEQLGTPQTVSMKALSVVVLGTTEERRGKLADLLSGSGATVIREGSLPDRDELSLWVGDDCDVLIVDLDCDQEHALELVEVACRDTTLTVTIYSRQNDPGLLLRAMRAGARELLSDPLSANSVAEVLVRASIRRDELTRAKKPTGRVIVFVGAKGGSGVTTIAANFAALLAKTSSERVALLDLNVYLGDAALALGVTNEFSTLDALRNERRLDSDFVSTMFVQHSSGLSLLAASDKLERFQPSSTAVAKLVSILRGDFGLTVVDAGSDYPDYVQALFDIAEKVYLVSQVSIVELRNCHRIIEAHFKDEKRPKLEVILNRHAIKPGEIDEATITKALTVQPAWKIPSDFAALRDAQNASQAVAMKDGSITRGLFGIVRSICGAPAPEAKRKRFGLF